MFQHYSCPFLSLPYGFVAEASIILFQKSTVIVYICIKMLLKFWLLDDFWTAFSKALLFLPKLILSSWLGRFLFTFIELKISCYLQNTKVKWKWTFWYSVTILSTFWLKQSYMKLKFHNSTTPESSGTQKTCLWCPSVFLIQEYQ